MSDDLIRRSDAIKVANEFWYKPDIAGALAELPAIEPKRGKWIEVKYTGNIYGLYRCQYKCSCCGYVPMHRGEPIVPTTRTLLYCPNCGADMREVRDE